MFPSDELQPAVVNSAFYKNPVNSHIFGEVRNNFSHPIQKVKVYGAIFDANGKIIATADSFTKDNYLKPNQTSGFWLLFTKDIPANSNYTLKATYQNSSIVKPEMLGLKVDRMSLDPVQVSGTVTNLGDRTTRDVAVSVVFYDQNHKVVDSDFDFINIDGLSPGQKSNFNFKPIVNYENADKITDISLNAESNHYTMMSDTK